jgi:hypothetical protein
MYRIRADRLGSLCACKSVDPGRRGAMHARVLVTFQSELPSLSAFACAFRRSAYDKITPITPTPPASVTRAFSTKGKTMAKQTHEWSEGDIVEMVCNTVATWVEKRDEMRDEAENGETALDADWFDRYEAVVFNLHSFKEMLAGLEREGQGKG